jgi:predicted amidophosphoribosyltransferase
MQKNVSTIASLITHLLFRVRPTERLTESLTVADLERLSRYDGTLPYADKRVRALVWEVKYYKDSRAAKIAGEYLAQLLLAEAADLVGTPLLIPMPMHSKRRKERGHNQTEVLCLAALKSLGVQEIGRKNSLAERLARRSEDFFYSNFLYAPHLLTRARHTLPQQGLERHNRLRNLKNAMAVADSAKVKGRVCIVVDDVTTTGASFAEAKRALRIAGAAEVRCIALAQS